MVKHLGLYFGPIIGKDLQGQYVCATTWRKSSKRQHVCSRPMKYSWSRENGSQPEVFLLTILDFGTGLVCVSGIQRSELFTNGPYLLLLPGNVGNGPEFEVSVFSIPSHTDKKKDVIIHSAAVFQSAQFPCDPIPQ